MQYVYICVLLGTLVHRQYRGCASGVCFVSTLNSPQFPRRAIFEILRPFAPPSPQFNVFAPPSRRTTTNRSSSFSPKSGTRHAHPARIASHAKIEQEARGAGNGMSVNQETIEKLQSYAFRPTGKSKRYKSERTSEGRCNCSSTSRRRFFHFGSVSITRDGRAFRAIRQIKSYC